MHGVEAPLLPMSTPAYVAGEINRPEIVAEVRAEFDRYEAALLRNDRSVLDGTFWISDSVVRYGVAENAIGIAAVQAARANLIPVHPGRTLHHTVIATFGADFATVCTEFESPDGEMLGRQSQSWVRLPTGWKIVAAHVSEVDRRKLTRY